MYTCFTHIYGLCTASVLLNSGTSMFQGNITYYTRIVFVV